MLSEIRFAAAPGRALHQPPTAALPLLPRLLEANDDPPSVLLSRDDAAGQDDRPTEPLNAGTGTEGTENFNAV